MTHQERTTEAPRSRRKIPPLVWIVLALVAAWIIGFSVYRGDIHRTPSGGTMPQVPESTKTVPAVPPSSGAPGTPATNGPTP